MSIQDLSSQLAVDVKGLADLKRAARDNTPEARRAVAQQFEALFIHSMLKSMREATPRSELFDSEQTRFFESMHDEQLAQVMASRGGGIGLARVIERQLANQGISPEDLDAAVAAMAPVTQVPAVTPASPLGNAMALPGGEAETAALSLPTRALLRRLTPAGYAANASAAPPAASWPSRLPGTAGDFVARVWPHAEAVSRRTGIPAHFMVAQAALETGWGQSEPRLTDGRPSHNLFGIKAGSSWSGAVVRVRTQEWQEGRWQQQVAPFRAYASYADAFHDYAELLSTPRYAAARSARDATGFAQALQQAGYATDPQYARKLQELIGSVAMRQQLALG